MPPKTTQPDLTNHTPTRTRSFSEVCQAVACMMLVCAVSAWVMPAKASAQDSIRSGAKTSLNNGLPPEASGITVEQNLGTLIPTNYPMTDSEGRPITTGYIFNGQLPTIVTLNYSDCPMLCSVQLNKLVASLSDLDLKIGKDFQILTLSIDPSESTRRAAETKAKYLAELKNQPGAGTGWTFATAKQPIITKMANKLGFKYRYDASIKQYNHPAMLAYVSPTGVITRYSLSIEYPVNQLKLSLVEAGEGTVGTPVDQFIFWCYSYDPDSNSYTPAAWKIMRLCGFGFLVLMLAALTPYWLGRKGGGTPGSTDPASELSAEGSA